MGPFRAADAQAHGAAIGVDEVGRGALCGPVLIGAVWFDPVATPPDLFEAIDDSKRLAPRRRVRLAQALGPHARVVLVAASAAQVDALGLRVATLAAMLRAVTTLRRTLGSCDGASRVLIDGRDLPPGLTEAGLDARALIGGDRRVPQIAAASILAKVARDRLMRALARRWPGYGWEANVGYGAPVHLAGLRRLGPTPHHRLSFAPVAAACAAARAAAREAGVTPPASARPSGSARPAP